MQRHPHPHLRPFHFTPSGDCGWYLARYLAPGTGRSGSGAVWRRLRVLIAEHHVSSVPLALVISTAMAPPPQPPADMAVAGWWRLLLLRYRAVPPAPASPAPPPMHWLQQPYTPPNIPPARHQATNITPPGTVHCPLSLQARITNQRPTTCDPDFGSLHPHPLHFPRLPTRIVPPSLAFVGILVRGFVVPACRPLLLIAK